jgi:hypothetical protein
VLPIEKAGYPNTRDIFKEPLVENERWWRPMSKQHEFLTLKGPDRLVYATVGVNAPLLCNFGSFSKFSNHFP